MKPTFFTKRGEKICPIQLADWDEPVDVTIRVPNNYEHDSMVEEFTEIGITGEMVTHGSDLIESRLIRFIVDLEFEIPKDESMTSFISWKSASEEEKRNAIRVMESGLRDKINNLISGNEELTEDEASE